MRKKHPQKDTLLYRLVQPGAPSVASLSEETGISKPTLYAWLIQARNATFSESSSIGLGLMKKKTRKHRNCNWPLPAPVSQVEAKRYGWPTRRL